MYSFIGQSRVSRGFFSDFGGSSFPLASGTIRGERVPLTHTRFPLFVRKKLRFTL
jgi:hypothetical protein